jgi:hypothetical protein
VNQFFGLRWDAPALEYAHQAETPVGVACLWCAEPVADGEQGWLIPLSMAAHESVYDDDIVVRELGGEGCIRWVLTAQHRECFLLPIIGEQVGVTGHTRADALEASARWANRPRAT